MCYKTCHSYFYAYNINRENNILCHVTSYITTCRRIALKNEAFLRLSFFETGLLLTYEAL